MAEADQKLCMTEGCCYPVPNVKLDYCCRPCKNGTGDHGPSCARNKVTIVAEVVHLEKKSGDRPDAALAESQCIREGCTFPKHPGLTHGHCCNVCKNRGDGHGASCTARHHSTRSKGSSLHGFDEQPALTGKADAGGALGGASWRKGGGVAPEVLGEDISLVWRLHRPVLGVSSDKPCPVVVFFHGSGERGFNNYAQINQASRMLQACPEASYVLAVQCPLNRRWVEVHWGNKRHDLLPEASVALAATMDALDDVLRNARAPAADPTRVYLSGLSMGGFAVWDALTRWPGRFAGALAMSGGADNEAIRVGTGPPRLPPVWAFHGSLDTIVRPERSAGAIDALRKAGLSEQEARYTLFDGQGHGIWNHVLSDPSVGLWLFSHCRTSPDAPVENVTDDGACE